MQSRLTLCLDEALIRKAKDHARRTGRSVSQMVADYFVFLDEREGGPNGSALPPLTRSLYGVLPGADVDEDNYRRHLEAKHR